MADFLNLASTNHNINAVHQSIHSPCLIGTFPLPILQVRNNRTWNALAKSNFAGCPNAYYIHRAMVEGKKPLHYILAQSVNAVIQLDLHLGTTESYLPQIDVLEDIITAYPNAFYIHHIRNIENHTHSIMNWNNLPSRLQEKGELNRFPSQAEKGLTTTQQVRLWITGCRDYIRNVFFQLSKQRLYRYLEIDIAEDVDASIKLAIFLGLQKLVHMPHSNHNG